MISIVFYIIQISNALILKPPGTFSHASLVYGKDIWIFGGARKPSKVNNTCEEDANGYVDEELWKFNTESESWSYSSIPVPARRGATLCRINKEVYLHGGGIPAPKFRSIPLSDTWKWSPRTGWEELQIVSPNIYAHASCVDNYSKSIYSLGGMTELGLCKYLYVFNNNKWSRRETPFKDGIMGHTITYSEGMIYLVGGVFGPPTDSENFNTNIWKYNTYTGDWKIHTKGIKLQGHSTSLRESKRVIGGLVYADDSLIITGGFYPSVEETNDEGAAHIGGTRCQIIDYNIRLKTFNVLSAMSVPREFHSSRIVDNKLFTWGGYHIGNFWELLEITRI